MNRREFFAAAGLGVTWPLAGGYQAAAGPDDTSGRQVTIASRHRASGGRRTEKPNIIYIMADDLGYGDLSCYGQKRFRTPNIDRLASEGQLWTQHYAGATVCAPSRCCLMTGYHGGHAYIRGNREVKPEGQCPMAADLVTVAEGLQRAGYVTGGFGKWGLGPVGSAGDPNKQGFDEWFGYNCQRQAHSYYPDHLWHNDKKIILEGNLDGKQQIYAHDLIAEQALAFIRQHRDRPFFCYVPFTIPHAALQVPEDSLAKFRGKWPEPKTRGGHYAKQDAPRAAFAAMVTRMDSDVGRILDLVAELGINEKTLVIFTSDNGPHMEGGHDPAFFDSNGPLRGHKRDLYEGGIRVPFLARWPGHIQPGRVIDHAAAFWDFLPTAWELAGLEPPRGIDGISYVPTLLGGDQRTHEYLYWEFHEQGKKQAVRMGDWKAVYFVKADRFELYNLAEDLGETQDVAAKYPDIAAKTRRIMQEAHRSSTLFPMPFDPKQG